MAASFTCMITTLQHATTWYSTRKTRYFWASKLLGFVSTITTLKNQMLARGTWLYYKGVFNFTPRCRRFGLYNYNNNITSQQPYWMGMKTHLTWMDRLRVTGSNAQMVARKRQRADLYARWARSKMTWMRCRIQMMTSRRQLTHFKTSRRLSDTLSSTRDINTCFTTSTLHWHSQHTWIAPALKYIQRNTSQC